MCLFLQSSTVALTAQHGLCKQTAVPWVCSATGVTVTARGSEVSNMRVDEVLHMQQEEDHLGVVLPAVKAAVSVCYVGNLVLLTVVQVCNVACALWQCVVWCLGVTVL
jgi:hypothetical protein